MRAPPAFLTYPDLSEKYAAGQPVLLMGRASSESGPKARKLAIDDLRGAAQALALHGVDVRGHLPSVQTMDADLQAVVPEITFEQSGKPFKNRFVVYDIRGGSAPNVVVILSTGSARKVSDEYVQPFMDFVARRFAMIAACLAFAKRLDRQCRNAWALGPLMMRAKGQWIGDSRWLRRAVAGESVLVFFDAVAAEMEADTLDTKRSVGVLLNTDSAMVEGRVRFAAGRRPPPGFGRVKMRDKGGLLFLDDTRWAPAATEVAWGLSEIVDERGSPVSQVENVRFALAHLGKPGWEPTAVRDELSTRRFSTVALRETHQDFARAWQHRRADVVLQPILKHLPVYESGVLVVKLGGPDQAAVTITGCIPPDGPWATAEDFARIRRYYDDGGNRIDRQIRLVLAGTKVTADGVPAKLTTASIPGEDPTHYRLKPVSSSGALKDASANWPLINAREVNNALIEGIAAAGAATEFVGAPMLDTPEIQEARRALIHADDALAAAEAELQRLYREINVTTGALKRRLNTEYNKQDEEVVRLSMGREDAQLAFDGAIRSARLGQQVVQDSALLELVSILEDPGTTTLARNLRQALTEIRFQFTPVVDAHDVQVEGGLAVGSEAATIVIPFHGKWLEARARTASERVHQVMEQMATGVPFAVQDVERRSDFYAELEQEFGLPRADMIFLNCLDPRILRVGVHATVPQFRDGRAHEQLAADLGEPVALIRHVAAVWSEPGRRTPHWLSTAKSPRRALWYALGSSCDEGLVLHERFIEKGGSAQMVRDLLRDDPEWSYVSRQGWRLLPCKRCGSTKRCRMRLREVQGAVCLACRTDAAGVSWPSSYDGYIEGFSFFVERELIPLGAPVEAIPARWAGRSVVRKLQDVPPPRSDGATSRAAPGTKRSSGRIGRTSTGS